MQNRMNKIEDDFLRESEIILTEVLHRKLSKIEKEKITRSLTDILYNFTSTIINENYYFPYNNASYFCQQPYLPMLPYENDNNITSNTIKNRQSCSKCQHNIPSPSKNPAATNHQSIKEPIQIHEENPTQKGSATIIQTNTNDIQEKRQILNINQEDHKTEKGDHNQEEKQYKANESKAPESPSNSKFKTASLIKYPISFMGLRKKTIKEDCMKMTEEEKKPFNEIEEGKKKKERFNYVLKSFTTKAEG